MKAKIDKYLFFDESGTGGDNIFLALGVVVCADPATLHNKLAAARKRHAYLNEIKFEKMSEKRLKVAQAFLRIFAKEQVFFKAVVVNKKKIPIAHFDYKHWSRFNQLASELLNKAVNDSERAKMFADKKTSPAEDNFSEYLQTHVKGLVEIVAVDSKAYDLVQLCDLLLGAVRASFEQSVKSPKKLKLIQKILKFSSRKVELWEYKTKFGQPSKTESGQKS